MSARFGIQVDHDNGHHVHFRLFAATGLQHLGSCGPQQTMRVEEFKTFRALLESTELITVLDETRTRMRDAEASRGWVVARDGGRYCERCEGEIQRGHAYEEQPGTGGLLEHIHCPDQQERSLSRG